jgi:NAD(P)-dependent dehydrogenase (short-subunit alcohol dehydrogenase family)
MGTLEAHDFGKHGITVNAYAPGIVDTRLSGCFFCLGTSGWGSNPLHQAGSLDP